MMVPGIVLVNFGARSIASTVTPPMAKPRQSQ